MIDAKTALPEGYKPGLEGIIAGTSAIAEVDPVKDTLVYRGYAAHELAEKATYEEVSFLLLFGKLPNAAELAAYQKELIAERSLPADVIAYLKANTSRGNPMAAMRGVLDLLYMADPSRDAIDAAANARKAKSLIAKAPTIVAIMSRVLNHQEPIAPNPKLGHAANFLFMTFGKEPDTDIARIFDAVMIMYAEHGFNASTFSALVTASTLSDMHSAVASAIGTLKGPLHGGANEAAIEMLLAIGDESKAESWLKKALERKEKIMGFGHRIYKRQDSRAPYMKELAQVMATRVKDKKLFPLSVRLEEAVYREKKLFPNVDYHCAVAFYLMQLPVPIYTPIFAMARMAGWTAHVIEQLAANRLIRPDCFYTGPRGLTYAPVSARK